MKAADRSCSKDSDCNDCKLNWKLLLLAIVGIILAFGLFIWGFTEQHRANKEASELVQLIRKAASR